MKKPLTIAVVLFILGFLFFGIAGYCYWAILDVFETLKYYWLETQYHIHEPTVEMILNYLYGIVEFVVLGIISCLAGLFVLIKRKANT